MSLPFVFIDRNQVGEGIISLDKETSSHLTRSLRVRPGEKVTAVIPGEEIYHCKIVQPNKQTLLLQITSSENIVPSKDRAVLCLSLIKDNIIASIIRQVTELGIDKVFLFRSRNSSNQGISDQKIERLKKIALEASKQAKRHSIPQIELTDFSYVCSLAETAGIAFLLDEEEKSRTILAQLKAWDRSSYAVICGPEGGFSAEEKGKLVNKGAIPVRIARNILRTETAAFAAIATLEGSLYKPSLD